MIRVNITSATDGSVTKIFSGYGRTQNEEINSRPYFQHTGFASIPKAGSKGICDIKGNQIIMIATADELSDRPELSSETDVCIYSDANKYVKIAADGEITASNGSGSIVLKSNGDIELGSDIKKLLNEAAKDLYNNHGHTYAIGPTVLITSKPTTSIIDALVPAPMGNSHMTSKTEAE